MNEKIFTLHGGEMGRRAQLKVLSPRGEDISLSPRPAGVEWVGRGPCCAGVPTLNPPQGGFKISPPKKGEIGVKRYL